MHSTQPLTFVAIDYDYKTVSHMLCALIYEPSGRNDALLFIIIEKENENAMRENYFIQSIFNRSFECGSGTEMQIKIGLFLSALLSFGFYLEFDINLPSFIHCA